MANRLRKLFEEKNEKLMEQFAKSATYNDALGVVQEFIPDYTLEEMHHDLKKLKEIAEEDYLDVGELAEVAGGMAQIGNMRFDFGNLFKNKDFRKKILR